MRFRQNIKFLPHLLAVNLRAPLALRGAFLLQSTFMVLNNLIFFCMWIILFHNVKSIRGWRLEDIQVLFGLVAFSFGIAAIGAGGARKLSRAIGKGELDSYLNQPKNVLLQLLCSESHVSGWGDIVSGLLLILFSGHLSLATAPILALVSLCSLSIYLTSMVLFSSLSFWAGSLEELANWFSEILCTLSLYPDSLFSESIRIVLYTLIPAGFMSFLPTALIRSFSWEVLALLLVGTAFYAVAATLVFKHGLKHYQSGSAFRMKI